jgi:hypothetical protein
VRTRTFTLWQVAGGLVWSAGLTLAGYALGSAVPGIDRYLLPAIAVIVVISLIPLGIEFRRSWAAGRRSSGDAGERPPGQPGGEGAAADPRGDASGAAHRAGSRPPMSG